MVVPNWEHPKTKVYDYQKCCYIERYQPMFETPYSKAITEWVEHHTLWINGNHPDQIKYPNDTKDMKFYAEWNGDAPEIKYYSPFSSEEAIWFQVYENVSEGTPITPPFETKEELVLWMINNKDFWDYSWTKEQSENFVFGSGYAPSGIIQNGQLKKGYEVINNHTVKENNV